MLRTPEARLYRSTWSDGSIDLIAGFSVVAIGISYLFDLVFLTAIVPPVALVGWMVLRARVVEPRAGRAALRRDRRERARGELAVTAVVGVIALLAALVAVWAVRADLLSTADAVDALPAVLVALLALAAAVLTRSPRFIWYAVILVLGGVLTVVLGTGPAMPLLVGGAAAALTGGVLLGRLLAQAPTGDEV
jgi:hypothetical protein